MGRFHAMMLHQHVKGAVVTSIHDPDQESVSTILPAVGPVEVWSDPFALIASSTVDAVVIASPDHTHADYTEACLRNGKPVLCEKPLAESPDQCRRIIEVERSTGRKLLMVGFMRRFDPDYGATKQRLVDGVSGDTKYVRCVHRNRAAPSFFEGEVSIANAMVHEFDILRWLTGQEARRIQVSTPRTADKLRDPIIARLEMSGGIVADIEVFMNCGYGYDIRTEILCTNGVIEMARQEPARIGTDGALTVHPCRDFTERFSDAYRNMLREWITALETGSELAEGATASDGLKATEIAQAAIVALRKGIWIDVD